MGDGCELRSASGRCVCVGGPRGPPALGRSVGTGSQWWEHGQGGSGANSLADCRLCPCNLVTGADTQAATLQNSPWTPQGLPRALRNLGRMIPYKRLVTYAKQDDITNNQVI